MILQCFYQLIMLLRILRALDNTNSLGKPEKSPSLGSS
jgi:hypothetical protein